MDKIKLRLEPYTMTLPSLLLTLVLGVYPILWAIRYMFYEYHGFGQEQFVGLANFARLLHDEMFWSSVGNTFVYAAGKLLLTIPLSLVLAVMLNGALRGRHIFRAIFFLPTIISTAVMSVVFYVVFNSYNGILNQLLIKYGVVSESVEWLGPRYAMLTMIMVAAWGAIGNYMLLFLAGLQNIPRDIYESAMIDGANRYQQFTRITLPLLGPVMQMIIMLAITVSLKGYESILLITEGGPFGKTNVMYLYVYQFFFPISTSGGGQIMQDFGYGSATGFAAALIVGLITGVYFYASRRMSKIY
jgi:raffinose/stachyose/melibiose transport system permease protein